MNEKMYYVLPESGRVTVMRRTQQGKHLAVASCLAEAQAVALAGALNDLDAYCVAILTQLRRSKERYKLVVDVLRKLVDAQFQQQPEATPKEQFELIRAAHRDARELLRLIDNEKPEELPKLGG